MRVLVVPASKHGATAEIGRAIARRLRANGLDVDVSQPEHLFDLSPYGAFVLGSALYLGKWLDRALHLVDEHADAIRARPTWLFSSGPLGEAKPDEPIHPDALEHLLATTGAIEHRLFGGRLELERLGRTDRFIAKWVGATDGDHRDWDEIDAWVDEIAATLRPAGARAIDGIGRVSPPAY